MFLQTITDKLKIHSRLKNNESSRDLSSLHFTDIHTQLDNEFESLTHEFLDKFTYHLNSKDDLCVYFLCFHQVREL